MNVCIESSRLLTREPGSRPARSPIGVLVPVLALWAIVAMAAPAAALAQGALLRDRAAGEAIETAWSSGEWSAGGSQLPACATFPDGTTTGPEYPEDVDSLYCETVANGWNWTITGPSGQPIEWRVENLPSETEVCAQIFYPTAAAALLVEVDLAQDHMRVSEPASALVLYAGSFSDFRADQGGFQASEARRCALVRQQEAGACCLPDGGCVILPEAQCTLDEEGEWQGPGTLCEPDPCSPVPTDGVTWGRVKELYR